MIAGKVASEEDGRSDWNGMHDTNGDGKIDLNSEIIFGQAANAAKRDLGSKNNSVTTNYTQSIMEALIAGRKLINDNVGSALSTDQMDSLKAERDVAVDGWERAIAATVVHYINDLHSDLNALGTDDFNYANAAKHTPGRLDLSTARDQSNAYHGDIVRSLCFLRLAFPLRCLVGNQPGR